jgi:hypothetical protein
MIFFKRWFSRRKSKEGGASVISRLGAKRASPAGISAVQLSIGTAGV